MRDVAQFSAPIQDHRCISGADLLSNEFLGVYDEQINITGAANRNSCIERLRFHECR